jgi:hypothetical protein
VEGEVIVVLVTKEWWPGSSTEAAPRAGWSSAGVLETDSTVRAQPSSARPDLASGAKLDER